MAYNVIITGTRAFDDYELLKEECDKYFSTLTDGSDSESIKIITGDDGKAEKLAQQYAAENEYPVAVYPLDVDKYGSSAAMIRNTNMVAKANNAICFWNGSSGGVKLTIDICKRKGIACKVIKYNNK